MFGIITITVIASSIIAAAIEAPKLIKYKQFKEAAAYAVLFAIGLMLCIITGLKIRLPSPFELLVWFFKPINEWFAAWFPEGG